MARTIRLRPVTWLALEQRAERRGPPEGRTTWTVSDELELLLREE